MILKNQRSRWKEIAHDDPLTPLHKNIILCWIYSTVYMVPYSGSSIGEGKLAAWNTSQLKLAQNNI